MMPAFVFDFRRVSLTREETDAAPLTGVVRTVSVFFYSEIFTLYEMPDIHTRIYISLLTSAYYTICNRGNMHVKCICDVNKPACLSPSLNSLFSYLPCEF
jgi:hypothetical protein